MANDTSVEMRMTRLVLEVFDAHRIAAMTTEELSMYLTAVAQAGYQLLRSVEGDQFVRGWLDSALQSLDEPAPIALRRAS